MTGGADGFVKVYDNTFRLLLWFEKLKAGPISYLSFNQPVEVPTLSDSQEDVKEASSSRNNAPNGSSRPSSGASSTTSSSESIVSDIDIPEFVVSTSDGKVLLLEKSNATGNASGAAAVVAARLAIRADSRQKKKSALDWVDQSTVKGSNGDIHDASVSRPTSQAGGLSGSEIMKRPSSKPSSAGSTKSSETPSIKLILETLSSTISNLVTHPQKHCYAVSCQNGK